MYGCTHRAYNSYFLRTRAHIRKKCELPPLSVHPYTNRKEGLMQNPDHQKSKCPKCQAPQGEPCITAHGAIAEKVHYGRPHWSNVVDKLRPAKIRGHGVELKINIEQFKVVKDLLKDFRTGLPDDPSKPNLWPGTNICTDCGEPYQQPGLVKRCKKRHTINA